MHTQRLVLWPSVVAGALIMLASATAVFAASPTLSYSASGSTPGSTVTLSGTGFQAGETVSLSFGSYSVAPGTALQIIGSGYLANEPMEVLVDGSVIGTFSADASGSLNNSSVVLPSLPEGLKDITVRGTHSFHSSTITIWVQGSSS